MMRALKVNHLDHRLQQTDFRDETLQPIMPESALPYSQLEQQEVIFVLGCQLVREVPLAGVRVRKAQKSGARVYAMNAAQEDWHIPLEKLILVSPDLFVSQCAALVSALLTPDTSIPESLQRLLVGVEASHDIQTLATALKSGRAAIVTGAMFENHPEAALLRTLLNWIVQLSGAKQLRLTHGANTAGAWLAGMIPHRTSAGSAVDTPGMNTQAILESKMKGFLLMGVEPGFDISNPFQARQSLLGAEFVVVLSAYQNDSTLEYADVILPMGQYAETSGTYINVDQTWQTVAGAISPPGEARPAWKILRVLANMMRLAHFEFDSTEMVMQELKSQLAIANEPVASLFYPDSLPVSKNKWVRVGEWPLYRSDIIVRHADALQSSIQADVCEVRMHPKTAEKCHLADTATISQGELEITLPLRRDEQIAEEVVWVANALPETVDLGHAFAAITIKC